MLLHYQDTRDKHGFILTRTRGTSIPGGRNSGYLLGSVRKSPTTGLWIMEQDISLLTHSLDLLELRLLQIRLQARQLGGSVDRTP